MIAVWPSCRHYASRTLLGGQCWTELQKKGAAAHQVINAQLFELEHHRAQVGSQNLGVGLLLQVLLEGGFSIEPEAFARLCAPSSPCPLMRTGLHRQERDLQHWVSTQCSTNAVLRFL